jgi:hypothetical protein
MLRASVLALNEYAKGRGLPGVVLWCPPVWGGDACGFLYYADDPTSWHGIYLAKESVDDAKKALDLLAKA